MRKVFELGSGKKVEQYWTGLRKDGSGKISGMLNVRALFVKVTKRLSAMSGGG